MGPTHIKYICTVKKNKKTKLGRGKNTRGEEKTKDESIGKGENERIN